MSWLEKLSDPDEGPLFKALLDRPRDLANRLVYERFLQARSDPRAELMALTNRMLEGIADDEARRATVARVAELAGPPEIDVWIDLLVRTMRLQNCGGASREAPRVHFTFECPQSWDGLRPTEDPKLRFCDSCSTAVVRCDTVEEAEKQALLGACIAVTAGLVQSAVERHRKVMVTGRPDFPAYWAEQLFPEK
jgi:uncharacterized protein (TIGR02996 family)